MNFNFNFNSWDSDLWHDLTFWAPSRAALSLYSMSLVLEASSLKRWLSSLSCCLISAAPWPGLSSMRRVPFSLSSCRMGRWRSISSCSFWWVSRKRWTIQVSKGMDDEGNGVGNYQKTQTDTSWFALLHDLKVLHVVEILSMLESQWIIN